MIAFLDTKRIEWVNILSRGKKVSSGSTEEALLFSSLPKKELEELWEKEKKYIPEASL